MAKSEWMLKAEAIMDAIEAGSVADKDIPDQLAMLEAYAALAAARAQEKLAAEAQRRPPS